MTWFKYEWRDAVNKTRNGDGAAPTEEAEGDDILRHPFGRFVEGFRVESNVFQEDKLNTHGNPRFTVIYEENTAVNRVCWNPNLICGTWAAAATVSGLIRIEDLALD
jgi:transcription factor C subunit 6